MITYRLGDIIDDYCTRCRLPTNHSVVAMVSEEVKKVRCRTCQHEHDYRQGKGGKNKQNLSAYEQVLASVLAGKALDSPPQPTEADKPAKSPRGNRTLSSSTRTPPRRRR